MPKARIAALGARFDPRMLTRVSLSDDEEVREAMAYMEAAHDDMRRRPARTDAALDQALAGLDMAMKGLRL
jgi:hypothetical protein